MGTRLTVPASRRVSRAYGSSYAGAVPTRLDTAWLPGGGLATPEGLGGYLEVGSTFQSLRQRARNLVINNAFARICLDRAVQNIIGRRIDLRPSSSSPEFNEQAAREWRRFTRRTNADVRGRSTWGGLCRGVCRRLKRDGDVGVILVDQFGLPKIQVVHAGLIETPRERPGRGKVNIVDGVELNDDGVAVAYWIRRKDRTHARVEAKDFIFLENETDKEDVVRGESDFNGTFFLYDQIAGVSDAIVVAMRVAASAALVESEDKEPEPIPDGFDDEQARKQVNHDTPDEIPMSPGTIMYAGARKLTQFDPKHPTQKATEFITFLIRVASGKLGVSVSQVLFDFAGMNYSVSRAERISIDRIAQAKRDDLIDPFAGRLYGWVIAKAIKRGDITVKRPDDWNEYEYIPDDMPIVDEEHHYKAVETKLRLGLASWTDEALKGGKDYLEVQRQRKQDRETRAKNGEPDPNVGGASSGKVDDAADALAKMADSSNAE